MLGTVKEELVKLHLELPRNNLVECIFCNVSVRGPRHRSGGRSDLAVSAMKT